MGMSASDESAADDAESVEMARARSTGERGCCCTGSVAAECADDVDGRRKIARVACAGVCTVRMLVGDVDAVWKGGDDDSRTCAASGVTMSGARCPWPYDWPRMSGCGRRACVWSAMSERVDGGRPLPDEWRSERGEVGVGGSVRAPFTWGMASGVRGGDGDCSWSRICEGGRRVCCDGSC